MSGLRLFLELIFLNMRQFLTEFLSQPHPSSLTWMTVLLPSGIVSLLLVILMPFGFHLLAWEVRVGYSLLFGIVSGITSFLVVFLLKKSMPKIMEAEEWTLGKELILHALILLAIAMTNTLVIKVLFSENNFWTLLSKGIAGVFGMGLIPVTILILLEQYQLQKKQFIRATQFNALLALQLSQNQAIKKQNNHSVAKNIILESENGKVEIQLRPEELIYLKSDGNYIEVYFEKNQKLEKILIRNRLKTLFEALPESDFLHCHKSYVVNGRAIVQVMGNARNFTLQLRGTENTIPVSRSNADRLQTFLKNLN